MDFIQLTTSWHKGEVLQGKIMLGTGIVLLIVSILIYKYGESFYKGMIVPMLFVVLIMIGYGGYQIGKRAKELTHRIEAFQNDPNEIVNAEIERSEKEDKQYARLIIIWSTMLIVASLIHFFVGKTFYKGLALGFVFLALSGLLIDNALHKRVVNYGRDLEKLPQTK